MFLVYLGISNDVFASEWIVADVWNCTSSFIYYENICLYYFLLLVYASSKYFGRDMDVRISMCRSWFFYEYGFVVLELLYWLYIYIYIVEFLFYMNIQFYDMIIIANLHCEPRMKLNCVAIIALVICMYINHIFRFLIF